MNKYLFLILCTLFLIRTDAAVLDITGWNQEGVGGQNAKVKITGVATGEVPFFTNTAGQVQSRKIITTDINDTTSIGRSLMTAADQAAVQAIVGISSAVTIPGIRIPYGNGSGSLTSELTFSYDAANDRMNVGKITLGSAVKLESDGVDIFSLIGNGSNENLLFNLGTADQVTISSSTGVDSLIFSGIGVTVPGEVYGAGWNGSNEVPTKNDLYDKIETLGGGGGSMTAAEINEELFGVNSMSISSPVNSSIQFDAFSGETVRMLLGANTATISSTTGVNLFDFGSIDVTVPTEVYGAGWDGDLTVPTKDALYDGLNSALSGYIENNANIEDLSDNSLASQVTFESGTVMQGPSVAALPALVGDAMDLTEYGGIHSATSNATLTFSGSPVTGQIYLLAITADGTQRTTTIPSSYSINTGANITSVVTPANATQYLTFRRESARWVVFGDPTPTTGSGNYVLSTLPTITTPTFTGAITFPDNVEQVFNPGAANAGLNVGSIAGDPSAPNNGALWYDSTANELTARINGANIALGAGGGGSSLTATYVGYGNGSNALTGEAAFTYDATTDTLTVGNMNIGTLSTTTLVPDAIEFEGATADAFETSLVAADPTGSDKTITLPDADGYVMLSDGGPIGSTRIPYATASDTFTAESVFNYNAGTDTLSVPNLTLSTGGSLGAATATTPSAGDNDTSVATTAYVQGEIAGLGGGSNLNGSVSVTVDGGGSVLTAGTKGMIVVPHTGTITGWSIVADQSGSVSFDVQKAADGATTNPTVSIVASAPPALSSDQIERSTSVGTWTTPITAFDLLEFEITGTPVSITRATLQIHYTRGTAGSFGTTVDGGGSVITAGSKGMVIVPFACTITGWSIVADASGDIEFDVERAADGATTNPTVSLVAAAPPALSGAQVTRSTSVGTWTTAVAANDVIEFEVTGTPATITRATIQIHYTR